MNQEQSAFSLKLLAISLGVVLLGVIGLAVYVTLEHGKHRTCARSALDLKGRGEVETLIIHPQETYAVLRKPGSLHTMEIVTLDTCKGTETGSVTLEVDGPPARGVGRKR